MPAMHLRIRILHDSEIAIGPGKADLLEAIAATGSISAGARQLGMSYRRAWQLIDTMNRCFSQPLVSTATGGHRGGGARLTAFGQSTLGLYRDIERIAAASVRSQMQTLMQGLRPRGRTTNPPTKKPGPRPGLE